jgi:MFS family permease
MNTNLFLLALCQGLFLTNNVTFIAINGLVGLSLAPVGWMATLPVMGYVVGGALSTGLVAKSQAKWGRRVSFQLGLLVGLLSAVMCAYAAHTHNFALLTVATLVAGYYSANGQLYRFAAAELAEASFREKAVSWVMAGGLIGAIVGPNLAAKSKGWFETPFMGAYVALTVVAVLGMVLMHFVKFPPVVEKVKGSSDGRPLSEIMKQPVFIVAAVSSAMSYGVMNLLMAATPLAMQVCGYQFSDAALVLEWHVIGMFAPGFITGHLIKKFGTLQIMGVGVLLNFVCIAVALSGTDVTQFLVALFLLGVGWNFVFTGSTTLSMTAWRAEEKDRGQAAINFCVFATMAFTSFASGALVTTQGWAWLNYGSLIPVALIALSLVWMVWIRKQSN